MIEMVVISGEPDAEARRCYDCRHCQAAVTWWCLSDEAKEARGTRIPGIQDCPFWTPARKKSELTRWERFALWFGAPGGFFKVTVGDGKVRK